MKIYYDTQFKDEGAGAELRALGAVSADGQHEFFVDLTEGADLARTQFVAWLSQFPGCWLLAEGATQILLLKRWLTGEQNAHHGVIRLQPAKGRQFSISLFQPKSPEGAARERFEAAWAAHLAADGSASPLATAKALRAAVLAAEPALSRQ